MAGKVVASQFTGAFAKLNGSTDINATRADIIRSLLTVGYPSRKKAILKVGLWRTRMLSAMAYGYLDRKLRTTEYFRNLEQTEKVGVSFLLGQAFTHWFAQDRMGIEFLEHVAGFKSITWGTSSATVSPKTGASTPSPKKVLSAASGQEPASPSERQQRLDEVFGILAHRASYYRERRTEEVSPGPDGMLLIDRRPGGIRPRRKKT